MELTQKQRGVLYIHKKYLKLYIAGRPAILQWNFPPTVVNNMEVLDSDELIKQVKLFLQQNKVSSCQLLFILSPSILFEKDLTGNTATDQAAEVNSFLDTVPFDEILSKVYTVESISHIMATNKELVRTLKQGFEAEGCVVLSAFTLIALGKTFAMKPDFDNEMAEQILKKADELRQYDLTETEPKPNYFHYDNSPQARSNKKQLPLLIGVFVILLGVLGILLWTQSQPLPKPLVTPTAVPLRPTTSLTSPVPSTPVTKAKVQILYPESTVSTAEKLKQEFITKGFTDVLLSTTSAVLTKPLITYTSRVSIAEQTSITDELKKILGDITIQQTAEAEYDIGVTLSK